MNKVKSFIAWTAAFGFIIGGFIYNCYQIGFWSTLITYAICSVVLFYIIKWMDL